MSLSDAVIGLKAYKEVDERATKLWHDIENAILLPRMDITLDTLPGIHIEGVSTAAVPMQDDAANLGRRIY